MRLEGPAATLSALGAMHVDGRGEQHISGGGSNGLRLAGFGDGRLDIRCGYCFYSICELYGWFT